MAISDLSTYQNGQTNAAMIYYKKRALDFLRKDLRFDRMASKERIEGNNGLTINHSRIDTLAAATTALATEGVAPSEASMTMTTFNFTVQQYGNWVKSTDLVEITERSNTMDQWSSQLGYNGGLSLDSIAYAGWVANATKHYSNNTNAGTFAADSVMTAKEIRRLAKKFRTNDVRPHEDGFYHLVMSPEQEFDIVTDDTFASVSDYQRRGEGDKKDAEMGKVGQYGGFKVFTSSLVDTATVNSQTAYRAIATGYGAGVSVELAKMPFKLFVNPASNVNLSNPLGQQGSIGWKASYVFGWVGSDGPRAYLVYSTASEPTA